MEDDITLAHERIEDLIDAQEKHIEATALLCEQMKSDTKRICALEARVDILQSLLEDFLVERETP